MDSLAILKKLVRSKTVAGLAVLLLNSLVFKAAPITQPELEAFMQALTGGGDIIGAVLVIWGRLTARGPMVAPAPQSGTGG